MPMIAALLLPLLASTGPTGGDPLSALPAASARMAAASRQAGVPFPFKTPEIRVFKAAHRLELWADGKRIKGYRTGLSNRGLHAKRKADDHLTPEGRFYICSKSARSAYHLFLGISYPDAADAERGLREGLINRQTHAGILAAVARKGCPPWGTALGGTVGIHGHGGSSDWTWGCMALEDPEVDEIWASCPLGTPVIIAP